MVAKVIGLISSLILLVYFPKALGVEYFAIYMIFIAQITLASQLIVLGLPIILMRDNLNSSKALIIPNNLQFLTIICLYFIVVVAINTLLQIQHSLYFLLATAALSIIRLNIGLLRGKEYVFWPQLLDGTIRNLLLASFLFYSLDRQYFIVATSVVIFFVSILTSILVLHASFRLEFNVSRSSASGSTNLKIFCGNDIQKVIDSFFVVIVSTYFPLSIIATYTWLRQYFNYSYELGSMLTYTYIAEIRRNILNRVTFCRYKLAYLLLSILSISSFSCFLAVGAYLNILPIHINDSFTVIAFVIITASIINCNIGPVTAWGSITGQEKNLLNVAIIKLLIFSFFMIMSHTFNLSFAFFLCGYYVSTITTNLLYAYFVKKNTGLNLLVASDLITFFRGKFL